MSVFRPHVPCNTSRDGVRWSIRPEVGRISPSGLYTAPSSIANRQTVEVTAISEADPTKSFRATITLIPAGLVVSVILSPLSATLEASQTQAFKVTVIGPSNKALKWSCMPQVGRISQDGVYPAPSSMSAPQNVTVTATSIADPARSSAARVTLKPAETGLVNNERDTAGDSSKETNQVGAIRGIPPAPVTGSSVGNENAAPRTDRSQWPSSGTLVWEGEIHGTELVEIKDGRSDRGNVTGALPGVACMVQPTDPRHVSIAVAPAPSNGWNRVVLRIQGKGHTRVRLTWSVTD